MNLPVRRRLPHEIPQWVAESSVFFITITCETRSTNQLCLPDVGEAILAAATHNHQNHIWHCRLMLLMPDHLHAIISFPREPGLKTVISNWKKFLARTRKIHWQRDFFDHRLRDHHEELEKTNYILMNPVRKGLCVHAEDWPWVYSTNDFDPPISGQIA